MVNNSHYTFILTRCVESAVWKCFECIIWKMTWLGCMIIMFLYKRNVPWQPKRLDNFLIAMLSSYFFSPCCLAWSLCMAGSGRLCYRDCGLKVNSVVTRQKGNLHQSQKHSPKVLPCIQYHWICVRLLYIHERNGNVTQLNEYHYFCLNEHLAEWLCRFCCGLIWHLL